MKFINFKEIRDSLKKELDSFKVLFSTNPKIILWRMRIFGFSPFVSKNLFNIFVIFLVSFSFFISFYILSWKAPFNFPSHILVTVERGESLSQIAKKFEQKNIVQSGFWLKIFVTFLGGEKKVIAGDYYFPEPKNIFSVSKYLHRGDFGLVPFKITIPEGLSSFEIASILKKELPSFDDQSFLDQVESEGFEGYLFPDTYFFMPNAKASDIILTMRENFTRQIKIYEEDIIKSQKDFKDIIIMASIIEDESNNSLENKRIVSGILWKRLKIGMPLQVDAPFIYYNGKHSYTLTSEDLKEDHPYNTYVKKGLPPTAITNSGIDSIKAAIAPTNTDYLYFMSDKRGNIYYAKDFEGHQVNRERYLR